MDLNLTAWVIVLVVAIFSLAPGIYQLYIARNPRYIRIKKKFLYMNNDGDDPCKQDCRIDITYKYIDSDSLSFFEV